MLRDSTTYVPLSQSIGPLFTFLAPCFCLNALMIFNITALPHQLLTGEAVYWALHVHFIHVVYLVHYIFLIPVYSPVEGSAMQPDLSQATAPSSSNSISTDCVEIRPEASSSLRYHETPNAHHAFGNRMFNVYPLSLYTLSHAAL